MDEVACLDTQDPSKSKKKAAAACDTARIEWMRATSNQLEGFIVVNFRNGSHVASSTQASNTDYVAPRHQTASKCRCNIFEYTEKWFPSIWGEGLGTGFPGICWAGAVKLSLGRSLTKKAESRAKVIGDAHNGRCIVAWGR